MTFEHEPRQLFIRTLPKEVSQLLPLTHALYQEFIFDRFNILVFHRIFADLILLRSFMRQGLIVKALEQQKPFDMRTTVSDSMDTYYIQDLVSGGNNGCVVVMKVPTSSILFRTEPDYRKGATHGSPIARYDSIIYGPLPPALAKKHLKSDEYFAHVPPTSLLGFYEKR